MRKIFGPKRDKVTGDWRRLHSEDLYDLNSSQNIIWVIKSRIMRRAEHVWGRRGAYWVLVRDLRERDLEDLGIDGRILK
jgi:hypothetical protein